MFDNTPIKQSLQFLVLCLIYSLQGPVFNAMPFLYYRSSLECSINGEWQDCSEQQICENNYEFKWKETSGMRSISMDFNLICENKLLEATIIATGTFGCVIAFLLAVLYEVPRHLKFYVLTILFFVESLFLISIQFMHTSVNWVMLVLFLWNFTYGYLYSLIFSFCNESYSDAIKEQSVGILNIFWPGGAVAFIFYAQIESNWINHIVMFSGYPILILTILFFVLNPKKDQTGLNQPLGDPTLDCPYKEAKENQKNFIQDLLDKFKLIKSDTKNLKNALLFMLCFVLAQLSYACPFIAFNSLGGNLQTNVMASILCDFGGSFVAYYLLVKFKAINVLYYNTILIGVVQSCTLFISNEDFYLQFANIMITKLSNRVTFPTLITMLPFILKPEFNQLVFSLTNLIAIFLQTFIAFYKYAMEQMGINIFFGVGILTLIFSFIVKNFTIIQQEAAKELPAHKLSQLKKSSFANSRKQSDYIIEQVLRKSSFISQQIGFYTLDKTSATYDKMFNNVKQELEIIKEEH